MTNSTPPHFDFALSLYVQGKLGKSPITRLSLLVNGRWITGEVKSLWTKEDIILLTGVTILQDSNQVIEARWLFVRLSQVSSWEWAGDEPDFSAFSLENLG